MIAALLSKLVLRIESGSIAFSKLIWTTNSDRDYHFTTRNSLANKRQYKKCNYLLSEPKSSPFLQWYGYKLKQVASKYLKRGVQTTVARPFCTEISVLYHAMPLTAYLC